MPRVWLCLLCMVSTASILVGQNPPASSPQALNYAARSMAALTRGAMIADVTLSGNVTWNGSETGTATLRASGTGESRVDLALTSGTRTEIRDVQNDAPVGRWSNPDHRSGRIAFQNCWTDAAWFFPALGSLAARPNAVLAYIGQEARNGASVQHLRSHVDQADWPKGLLPTPKQLSTMDFYLDATTFLPVAVTFNAHPDNDAMKDLLIEVDFSDYQAMSGVLVPTHIQRYSQGNLLVDITVTSASFNTGVPLSIFTVR